MAVVAALTSKHRMTGRTLFPPVFAIAAVSAARMAGWLNGVSLALLVAAIIGAAVVSEVVAVALPAGGSRTAGTPQRWSPRGPRCWAPDISSR